MYSSTSNKEKTIEKSIATGIAVVILGFLLLLFPMHSIFAKPSECDDMPKSGSVKLKDEHIGKDWDSFNHENCNEYKIDSGQILWHLVLSPVGKDAAATINGVSGVNKGGSIHWTFIISSKTAEAWVAEVSNGLWYTGPDCKLQTELRVSHTCSGETDTTETTAPETTAAETIAAETTVSETITTETTTTPTLETQQLVNLEPKGIIEVLGISTLAYTGFNFIYLVFGVISFIAGLVILAVKRIF